MVAVVAVAAAAVLLLLLLPLLVSSSVTRSADSDAINKPWRSDKVLFMTFCAFLMSSFLSFVAPPLFSREIGIALQDAQQKVMRAREKVSVFVDVRATRGGRRDLIREERLRRRCWNSSSVAGMAVGTGSVEGVGLEEVAEDGGGREVEVVVASTCV